MKELEDELMGDDFFSEYKKKRMQELTEEDLRPQFGTVYEVDKKSYVREVNEVSRNSMVVLHLF